MVKGLSGPENSVRAIIFFDLGIYSAARVLQPFFEQSDFREWKGILDMAVFWFVFVFN